MRPRFSVIDKAQKIVELFRKPGKIAEREVDEMLHQLPLIISSLSALEEQELNLTVSRVERDPDLKTCATPHEEVIQQDNHCYN